MNSIWIARDKDGDLWAFPSKPERDILSYTWITIDDVYSCRIPNDWLPEVTWENDPLELVPKLMVDGNTSVDDVIEDFRTKLLDKKSNEE